MGTTKSESPVCEQKGLQMQIVTIAGGIMAKNPRYYHTAVHKNITRDRFIRSVNPIVAEKMRAILEELKRKESGRG
jgi:hypothetical protein